MFHINGNAASAPRSQAAVAAASPTFEENVSFVFGEIDRMQKRIARLEADLLECREYLETEMDVVDGGSCGPIPNRAMTLVSMIDESLNGAGQ